MTKQLKEWLYTPCAVSDLLQLEKDVAYMPIGVVKQKIQYMEDNFNVTVHESGFSHSFFNVNQKECITSGNILISIYQNGGLINELIGTATFILSFYGTNTNYAATLESLCIVNAFGGKYPQFGSGLNKLDVVAPIRPLLPSTSAAVAKEEEKLFNAVKKKLSRYTNNEEATAYLNSTTFSMNLELKNLIQNLPLKNIL